MNRLYSLIGTFIFCSLIISHVHAQQSTTGKYRPVNVSKGIVSKRATKSQTLINNVPSYLWQHGCGPTALGMIVGYYDMLGFPDLIEGDASSQNDTVNNAIANTDHYNDYSLPIDSYPDLFPDKSQLGGAHISNCIADYMQTSWSSENNRYGYSWNTMVGNAFIDFVNQQNSDYHTETSLEYFSESSWSIYLNEINNDRPVVLLVDVSGDGSTDHFVTGIGYDVSDTTFAVYDTWDNDIHWYQWRIISTSYSWGIACFNILKIYFNIKAAAYPVNGGSVSGAGNYLYGQTANLTAAAGTGYNFANWTENGSIVSTNANYSFTATKNRSLVANFSPVTSMPEVQVNSCRVFPNPASDYLNVINNGNIEIQEIAIYNTLGKKTLSTQATNQINISGLKKGMYYVVLTDTKGNKATYKLIKE